MTRPITNDLVVAFKDVTREGESEGDLQAFYVNIILPTLKISMLVGCRLKLSVRVGLVAGNVGLAGVYLIAMAFSYLQIQGGLMVADELKLGLIKESVEEQGVLADVPLWSALSCEVPLGEATGILMLLVVRRVQVDDGTLDFRRDAIIRVLPQRRELGAEVVSR